MSRYRAVCEHPHAYIWQERWPTPYPRLGYQGVRKWRGRAWPWRCAAEASLWWHSRRCRVPRNDR